MVDGAICAVEQFGVVAGRELEVHSPDHVLIRGGVEALAEVALESPAPGRRSFGWFDEVAALVMEDAKLYDVAAGEFRFGELDGSGHRARLRHLSYGLSIQASLSAR